MKEYLQEVGVGEEVPSQSVDPCKSQPFEGARAPSASLPQQHLLKLQIT